MFFGVVNVRNCYELYSGREFLGTIVEDSSTAPLRVEWLTYAQTWEKIVRVSSGLKHLMSPGDVCSNFVERMPTYLFATESLTEKFHSNDRESFFRCIQLIALNGS